MQNNSALRIVNVRLSYSHWYDDEEPVPRKFDDSYTTLAQRRTNNFKAFCESEREKGPCLIRLHVLDRRGIDGVFLGPPLGMSYTADQIVVVYEKTGTVKWLKSIS